LRELGAQAYCHPMKLKLKGLIAAPFTAMNPDGSLNLDAIGQQAAGLVSDGVSGAFVCGTTGEGLSLSLGERMNVAERWVTLGKTNLSVIVHVGCNNIAGGRMLAEHAAQIGAHSVATMGPTFFRPARAEQLVDFCAEVAAAAPGLPFYFYHIPVMSGIQVPMIDFVSLAVKRIPNFAGLKFTDENLMSYAQCLNFEEGRCNILFGRDEILLAALALGATGAVGSTYNFMASLYRNVIDAFQKGDMETARHFQMAAIRIIAVICRYGGLPAGKVMMKMVGIDCGPVRLPLRNLSEEEIEQFRGDLEAAGFPLKTPEPVLDEH